MRWSDPQSCGRIERVGEGVGSYTRRTMTRVAIGSDHAGFELEQHLSTEFEGGRHARRVDQLSALEAEF